ncbi:MAG: hypothetical protein RLY43_2557 [Bacteroidota bacterium]
MDYKEALSLLELQDGFTEEQLKKNFKKLAAKYHPDINKEEGAEAKSKKISEAFNFLKDEKNFKNKNPFSNYNWSNYDFQTVGFDDFIHDFIYQRHRQSAASKIDIKLEVSFEESVKGKIFDIPVDFEVKCKDCPENKEETCKTCNGSKKTKKTLNLRIPVAQGTTDNSIIDTMHKIDDNSYLIRVTISVKPHPTMKLEYPHIFSEVQISLLQSLTGQKIAVDTIDGKKEITLPAKIKNGTNVIVRGAGVPHQGHHIFKINVEYPENVDDLVEFLKSKE